MTEIIIKEISLYINEINRIYKAGNATEHTYRAALKSLLEQMTNGLTITNEPKRIACGAPDYIISRKDISVGYIETKDIDENLNDKKHKEQFDRYKRSLDNLIITNYLCFQLYINGTEIVSVTLAKMGRTGIEADKTQFEAFEILIRNFGGYEGELIRTPAHLSKIMAAKAKLMANIIEKALDEDESPDENVANNVSTILGQLNGFREVLIHDMGHKEFADIYAQTIAYGMFAAKLNDTTLNSPPLEGWKPKADGVVFTRFKAAQLIPHSNPFLRKLFQYIAGYDLDERIRWIVEDLANLFNYVDINEISKEFDQYDNDPIIHFYETFLAEYDPALRKSRGVWYTPQPVVKFIVQAVDDILKRDFGLDGLMDTSKVKLKQKTDKHVEEEIEYHKVQILDPATGTGTFLAEVVQNIYRTFKSQQGMWNSYVQKHLIPRINGFEILMASYTMAHFKLNMLLHKTGYESSDHDRLRIYLTNSLEETHINVNNPLAQWLNNEARECRRIKNLSPIMVILGNPPYSVSSQNKGRWINDLLNDYKNGLNEKNIQPLSDDYIKFIRFGQYYIEKNGEGILAYISNNSFIDGLIHKQMRNNLLKAFDKIYIIDLHGNAKKKETAIDGSKDENVFDIQQGVSINIFVTRGHAPLSTSLAEVYHYDLYGARDDKYSFLLNNNLQSVQWKRIEPKAPYFFFVPKSEDHKEEYENGFKVDELLMMYSIGIKTQRDDASIKFTQEDCDKIKNDILNLSNIELYQKYGFVDVRDWRMNDARKDLQTNKIIANKIHYRPFDFRFMNYTGKTKGVMGYPRGNIMQHFLKGENIGLVLSRQFGGHKHFICFITNKLIEISSQPYAPYSVFPLYLYFDGDIVDGTRMPDKKKHNLNEKVIAEISQRLGLQFNGEVTEKTLCDLCEESLRLCGKNNEEFSPIDVLDYVYAVLHSPTYREKYKEFLKIDFPRVPYPENAEQFWKLVALGGKLRRLHLLEDVEPQKGIADFPIQGSDVVEKIEYHPLPPPTGERGRVYINDTQYFDNVPLVAWNFYIGGYQPAQKWLKDRKGRILEYDNMEHYKKIIWVLTETERVMRKVDKEMFF